MSSIIKDIKKNLKDINLAIDDDSYDTANKYRIYSKKAGSFFWFTLNQSQTKVKQISFDPFHFVDAEYPNEAADLTIVMNNHKETKKLIKALTLINDYM